MQKRKLFTRSKIPFAYPLSGAKFEVSVYSKKAVIIKYVNISRCLFYFFDNFRSSQLVAALIAILCDFLSLWQSLHSHISHLFIRPEPDRYTVRRTGETGDSGSKSVSGGFKFKLRAKNQLIPVQLVDNVSFPILIRLIMLSVQGMLGDRWR